MAPALIKTETQRLVVRSFFFICYLATGMLVFRALESENEMKERGEAQRDIELMRSKFNISAEEMKEFVQVIERATSFGFMNSWIEKWSYTGSLFFSGTVITTIGE